MAYLPLANILHHRLRSVLSAVGIGIGVCMLITLTGLSRGSIREIIDRWNTVDAELIVYPSSTNLTMASGGAINEAAIDKITKAREDGQPVAARVTPVYLARMSLAEREHNIFGVNHGDFDVFSNEAPRRGGPPDANGEFAAWLDRVRNKAQDTGEIFDPTADELTSHGGLEIAIDTRLARMLGKGVGDTVYAAGHTWRIVGVYDAGPIARAFVPLGTLQCLYAGHGRVTMLFVKLRDPAREVQAIRAINHATRQTVVPRAEYQSMLMQNVGVMYTYVNAVNAVALTIAFLFTMVTLYTMVLQRTREIAILKSMGAGRLFLMRQVLAESALLTAGGVIVGIVLAVASGRLIEYLRADLTVTITSGAIGAALLAAAAGSLLAALYPAWRAIRVDVAESLTLE